jgi:hypothetical protein
MGPRSNVAEPVTLPPRAEVARLTLLLRAAVRRAEEAERLDTKPPVDAAALVLRDRLAALLAERRAALSEELRGVEREAADLVEAARVQATSIRASRAVRPELAAVPETAPAGSAVAAVAATPIESPVPEAPPAPTEVTAPAETGLPDSPPTPLVAPPPVAPPAAPPLPPQVALAPPLAAVVPASPPALARTMFPPAPPVVSPSPWAPPAGPAEAAARPVMVMIDPESFGQAVAAAIAAVLAQRPEVLTPRAPMTQWVQAVPVAAQHKKSFWSGLWHADVVLAVLAMAIILVILLAWSV